MADVGDGALVLVWTLSKTGRWLYVEDTGGHKGWVQTAATDFGIPFVDREETIFQPKTTFKSPPEEVKEPEGRNPLDVHHGIFASVRSGFDDPNGTLGIGGKYFFFVPLNKPSPSQPKFTRAGIETGYWSMSDDGSSTGFTIPLRVKFLRRNVNSFFTYGLDAGVLFQRVDKGGHLLGSLSLGGTIAYFPLQPGFAAMLRLGGEFFHENRVSLEFDLGWVF